MSVVDVELTVYGDGFINDTATVNETLEEYLLRVRGPKHLPLEIVIPITIVYSVIFVSGLVGNIAVCAVIIRNSALHTATNYYLFNLAISDLTLLLLGLPNDLSVYWQQYPWALGEGLCKVRALVSEMTSYTSVLTIVAFSMERYLAICHPLYSYTMSGLHRALRIIAGVWVVSLISATPFAVFSTVNYVTYPPNSSTVVLESGFCAMLEDNLPAHLPVYELSSFLYFLVPMFLIVVLYVRMGLRIRNSTQTKLSEGSAHRESRHSKSRKAIVRMLSAVVVAFFLCWAPFHTQRLLYLYARDSPNFTKINEWFYYITGCFYYFSSTVNPILYNLMSAKYRTAFRQTLCGLRGMNGLGRESSFRETTIGYTATQLSRGRTITSRSSTRNSNYMEVNNQMMGQQDYGSPCLKHSSVMNEEDVPLKSRYKLPMHQENHTEEMIMMSPKVNGQAKQMISISGNSNCDDAKEVSKANCSENCIDISSESTKINNETSI